MGVRDRRRPMDETWRARIQTGVLLDRLEKHHLGVIELTKTQIDAAKILLNKTMPDLKAVEHSGGIATVYESLTDDQLNAQISARLQQIARATPALTHAPDGDA